MSGSATHLGPEAGTTLVELLVYLVLAGLILSTAATAMHLAGASAARSNAASRAGEYVSLALARPAREIAQAERTVSSDGGTPQFSFEGTDHGLNFVFHGGRIGWHVLSGRGGDTLLRLSPAAREIGLAGRYRIRFAYRGPNAPWQAAWPQGPRMPAAVEIAVSDKDTGATVLPPRVIALAIDAEPACNSPDASGCTLASGGTLTGATP